MVIVGGGVSGLATAYFLGKLGIGSTLIEKSDRLGGLIRTDLVEGCRLEAGPDSYIAAKPAVTDLAQELAGLNDQIIGSKDEKRRIFVVREGRLVPMPQGMAMMVPAQWGPVLRSRLFSFRTKCSFFAELFCTPVERRTDVSVNEFIADHFGKEVLQYVVQPLLSGVYGGDSDRLSAESVLPRFLAYERKYGSLIRGARQERRKTPKKSSLFLSFRGGMQALTDSLAHAVAESTTVVHAEATRVERARTGWHVYAGEGRVDADQVVLACPAHASARLLEGSEPPLAMELARIRYSSAILVNLVYERSELPHDGDGFGFLVPLDERRSIAAATWVTTKFPDRAPAHFAVLRAFIVEPEVTELLTFPKEELIGLVRAEFKRLIGIEAAPRLEIVQAWPCSMPQYEVGHRRRWEKIFQLMAQRRGLYVTGNAYDGVGVPDCIRLAEETAKVVAAQIAV